MTTSTTIISPQDIGKKLQGLITSITKQVATIQAATAAIVTYTALQPVGVRGWIKQLNNILNQINNALRIIGMIEVLIVKIALLPEEAVILVIQGIAQDITALENIILAKVRHGLNQVISAVIPSSSTSSLAEAQKTLADAQQALVNMQKTAAAVNAVTLQTPQTFKG